MAGAVHQLSDALKRLIPLSARRALVRMRLRLRGLTARRRMLPDFIIVGCQRGGTSSLYKYLGRHPEIAPSLRKETEFFTINHHRGIDWYRAHFPLRIRRDVFSLFARKLLAFEATPDYLLDPRAPGRCRQLLPDAKIIILLREPGERALSQYHHNVRLGLETETFATAVDIETGRISADIEEIGTSPDTKAVAFRRFSYVERGKYSGQVGRWLHEYRRDQVLILESEDFFANPAMVLQQILDFVGVRPWVPPEFRNYSYPEPGASGHEEVPAGMRTTLDAAFTESNAALRDILDTKMKWLDLH